MRVESRLPEASSNKSTALICAGLEVSFDCILLFLFGFKRFAVLGNV